MGLQNDATDWKGLVGTFAALGAVLAFLAGLVRWIAKASISKDLGDTKVEQSALKERMAALSQELDRLRTDVNADLARMSHSSAEDRAHFENRLRDLTLLADATADAHRAARALQSAVESAKQVLEIAAEHRL